LWTTHTIYDPATPYSSPTPGRDPQTVCWTRIVSRMSPCPERIFLWRWSQLGTILTDLSTGKFNYTRRTVGILVTMTTSFSCYYFFTQFLSY
jgi:hypothetical protein